MSKATRQVMMAIAYLDAGCKLILKYKVREDIHPTILWLQDEIETLVNHLPEVTNTDRRVIERVGKKMQVFDNDVETLEEDKLAVAVIHMSHVMFTDILEKVKDKKKIEVIQPIMDAIDILFNTLDENGEMFDAFEFTDEVLAVVYEELNR